jgi:hypothetical protein
LAAVTGRKFFEELGQLVGKPVIIEDAAGKIYEGKRERVTGNTLPQTFPYR